MKIAGIYPQKVTEGPQGEVEFFEPLGIEYVLAQVQDKHDTRLFTLFEKTEDQVIREVIEYNPKIVAISAMTPQINLSLKMARAIKAVMPKAIIILGGYHPNFDPYLVKRPEVDFVILGEGEVAFKELVETLASKKDFQGIKGLSFLDKGEVVITPAHRIENLDELSSPIRPNFLEKLRNRGMMYPATSRQTGMASILFSRGCKFACNFCTSPAMYGGRITYRSPANVVKELKSLRGERGINTFLFTDLNFTADKNKTIALCDAIIASGLEVYWECLSNISTANDRELLEKMRSAGCRKIGWGIESLNPQVIASMNKRGLEQTVETLQKSEDVGILNTGFYIIGHPSETAEEIRKYIPTLSALPLHRLRVTVYTPIPGSRLYNETKEKAEDFDLYDTVHLVFNHPNLNQDEIDLLRAEITRKFYGSIEYKLRSERVLSNFPEYKESFLEATGI